MTAYRGVVAGTMTTLLVGAVAYASGGIAQGRTQHPRRATVYFGNGTLYVTGRQGPDKAFVDRLERKELIIYDKRGLDFLGHPHSGRFRCNRMNRKTLFCDMPR